MLHPPQQQRSRDTLARIVNAASRLLSERSFDEVSVAEIVRLSKSSVGAFYARFNDKDALLDYLEELQTEELIEWVEQYHRTERWTNATMEEIISDAVGFLVSFFKERRGLLRALSLRARTRSGKRFSEAALRLNRRVPELMTLALSRRSEIDHPSPEQAVYVGFLMIFSTLRERMLFPEAHPTRLPLSDAMLADELARAYVAYLGISPSTRARRR